MEGVSWVDLFNLGLGAFAGIGRAAFLAVAKEGNGNDVQNRLQPRNGCHASNLGISDHFFRVRRIDCRGGNTDPAICRRSHSVTIDRLNCEFDFGSN